MARVRKDTEVIIPPPAVARAAAKGLALRTTFGRGGTQIGLSRGRQLAGRKPVSAKTILRMYSYFSRHLVDKQGKNFYNPVKPSNGAIAWLLWGGDPGASWAEKMRKKLREKG